MIDLQKETREHLQGKFLGVMIVLFLISFIGGFLFGIGYGVNQCIDFGIQIAQQMGVDLATYKPALVDLFNKYQGRTGIILNEAP